MEAQRLVVAGVGGERLVLGDRAVTGVRAVVPTGDEGADDAARRERQSERERSEKSQIHE
jgi:hypothetical protein